MPNGNYPDSKADVWKKIYCDKYGIKEATNIQFTEKGLSDLQPGAIYTTAINAMMLWQQMWDALRTRPDME